MSTVILPFFSFVFFYGESIVSLQSNSVIFRESPVVCLCVSLVVLTVSCILDGSSSKTKVVLDCSMLLDAKEIQYMLHASFHFICMMVIFVCVS